MKKVKWAWETLDEHTYRVKVIGGWMVVSESVSGKGNVSITGIFVADRDHEWLPVHPSSEKAQEAVKNEVPELLKAVGK